MSKDVVSTRGNYKSSNARAMRGIVDDYVVDYMKCNSQPEKTHIIDFAVLPALRSQQIVFRTKAGEKMAPKKVRRKVAHLMRDKVRRLKRAARVTSVVESNDRPQNQPDPSSDPFHSDSSSTSSEDGGMNDIDSLDSVVLLPLFFEDDIFHSSLDGLSSPDLQAEDDW